MITTENGEVTTEEKLVEGTVEEVKDQVDAMNDVDAEVKVMKKKVVEEKKMETDTQDH